MISEEAQELNKKLAEHFGYCWHEWIFHPPLFKRATCKKCGWERWIESSDSEYDKPNFTESLGACFKSLVPGALKILAKHGYVPPIMKLFQLWYDELVSLAGDSSNVQQASLALCLALEKLVDMEEKV